MNKCIGAGFNNPCGSSCGRQPQIPCNMKLFTGTRCADADPICVCCQSHHCPVICPASPSTHIVCLAHNCPVCIDGAYTAPCRACPANAALHLSVIYLSGPNSAGSDFR